MQQEQLSQMRIALIVEHELLTLILVSSPNRTIGRSATIWLIPAA